MKISNSYYLGRYINLIFLLAFVYTSASWAIVIIADELDHFEIVVSDTIVVGEPFVVTFIAKDKFNNTIVNFDQTGKKIEIEIMGTGNINPDAIFASEFKQGMAKLEFVYNKAEIFTLIVKTQLDQVSKLTTVARKVIKSLKKDEIGASKPSKVETKSMPSETNFIDRSPSRLVEIKGARSDVEEEIIRLRMNLEESTQEILDLKVTISELVLEKEHLEKSLERNRALLTHTETRLAEAENRLEGFTEVGDSLLELKSKLQSITNIKNSLQARLVQLTNSLDEKELENLKLQEKIAEIAVKNKALKSQLSSAMEFLEHAKAQLRQLRQVYSSLHDRLEELETKKVNSENLQRERSSGFVYQ